MGKIRILLLFGSTYSRSREIIEGERESGCLLQYSYYSQHASCPLCRSYYIFHMKKGGTLDAPGTANYLTARLKTTLLSLGKLILYEQF
jgi:hypothetical protein